MVMLLWWSMIARSYEEFSPSEDVKKDKAARWRLLGFASLSHTVCGMKEQRGFPPIKGGL